MATADTRPQGRDAHIQTIEHRPEQALRMDELDVDPRLVSPATLILIEAIDRIDLMESWLESAATSSRVTASIPSSCRFSTSRRHAGRPTSRLIGSGVA
jgi:hypothetical protein